MCLVSYLTRCLRVHPRNGPSAHPGRSRGGESATDQPQERGPRSSTDTTGNVCTWGPLPSDRPTILRRRLQNDLRRGQEQGRGTDGMVYLTHAPPHTLLQLYHSVLHECAFIDRVRQTITNQLNSRGAGRVFLWTWTATELSLVGCFNLQLDEL